MLPRHIVQKAILMIRRIHIGGQMASGETVELAETIHQGRLENAINAEGFAITEFYNAEAAG